MCRPRELVLLRWLLMATLVVAGCRAGEQSEDRAVARRTELSVFAASSLTEAFTELGRSFQAEHPTVDVKLAFAGSQILRLQIEQGALVDVFASANAAHMRALTQAGMVSRSRIFAHNELVLIVPLGNPAAIASFADLPHARRLVIGTDNVPIGIYFRQVLEHARTHFGAAFVTAVERHIVSEEGNVRLIRAKVELGEADAAVVYRTDAIASERVRTIPIPAAVNARVRYPIGISSSSRSARTAGAFVDFVLSEAGQRILTEHGFLAAAEAGGVP